MTESVEQVKPERINGRFAPGVSGNPSGRAANSPSEKMRLYLAEHKQELLDAALDEALNKRDSQMLQFLISRIISPLKPTHAALNLNIETKSAHELATALLHEALGNNAPDAALAALAGIKTVLEAQTASDLSDRIAALEQRLLTVNNGS